MYLTEISFVVPLTHWLKGKGRVNTAVHEVKREGAFVTQLETYRRGGNSTSGVDPVNFVRNVTADLPKVQPRNVLGWVGIWSIRQSFADEHGVIDSLELRSCAEVPDGRNPSRGVLDEIMLREDQTRGHDLRENIDQLLDRDAVGGRAVPELEQVVMDSRYKFAVGARKARYVEKLGNGAGRAIPSISIGEAYTHTKRTLTQKRC